jgi:membrane protein
MRLYQRKIGLMFFTVNTLKCAYKILIESLKSWVAHRAASKGAALAFYALFSMTPIVMLSIYLTGYFLGADVAQGRIIAKLQEHIGLNNAQTIQKLLTSVLPHTSGFSAPIFGSVILLLTTTSVFVELKGSLEELWGIEKTNEDSAFKAMLITRFLSFSLVLALTVLLFISLLLSAALTAIENYALGIWNSALLTLNVLNHLMSFGIITSLFAVISKVLPNAPLSWRDAWLGAVFTATLFTLGKYGIGLYLAHSNITSSFGAAGSIIALLLWIYYSSQIFFLGVEFTRQYAIGFGSLKHERQN